MPHPLIKLRRYRDQLESARLSDISRLANEIQTETGCGRKHDAYDLA